MIILPPNRRWMQNNQSDVAGSLVGSMNLNLTEQLGKTKISPRMVITTNGITDFGTPTAFMEYGGDLFCVASPTANTLQAAWKATGGLLKTAFVKETSANYNSINTSSDYSDGCIFNNKLVVSGSGNAITYFDTSTWTTVLAILTVSANHKLLPFLNQKRLYVTASLTQIVSLDTAFSAVTSGANTMNIATATATSDLFLTTLLQTTDSIWICTANFYNNECYIYTWNGVTADTITAAFKIDARGILAGVVKNGTPYVIDSDGRLLYCNGSASGGAFLPAPNGKLPIKQFQYLTNPLSQKNNRWIHHNGMSIVDGRISILVNNLNHDNTSTINEFLPSGIWEYVEDGENSYWYHKSSLTQYDLNGAASVTDFGQSRLSKVGALFNVKKDDRSSSTFIGTLMAGAEYYTTATVTKAASFTNDSLDMIQKYGYLVTSKMFSGKVQDTWRKLYIPLKRLLAATDKVAVKYRYTDDIPVEATITWTSTTTFTTTTDISSYWTVGIGGEVEVIQGTGSGMCSHITSIVNNAGTYTVTVDETYTGASGTAKARFQKWVKLSSFSDQLKPLASFADMGISNWIQIKVCALFTGNNEMYEFIIDNATEQ